MKNYLYILCLFFIVSCSDNRLYEQNKFIENHILDSRENIGFEFAVQDTNSLYDVYTNIRITADYPYSNIFLLMTATNPEGKVVKELIEYTLADVAGKWLGRGLGDIYDYRLLHERLKGMTFDKAGIYQFNYKQVMRVDQLKGVSAIGIRVVKHL